MKIIISRNDPIQEIALDIVFESSHILKPNNPYNIIHALLLATKVKAQPLGREAVTPRTAEHTVLGPLASSSATKLPGGHTLEEDTLLWLWHESLTKLPFRREKALARHHSPVKLFCQPC